MHRERWTRVEALFHAALAHPSAERDAFVSEACGPDDELRHDVRSLLVHESESAGFLEPQPLTSPLESADQADLPSASVGWSPPARIAHYRVLGRLGEGGMGVVYDAVDEQLRRRVALKVLRKDAADPQAADRLIREARVAALVTHPLICQVFELGQFDGQPFIAMELVDGEPLAARLRRGPIPPREALQIAISIADALAALHQHGIVHRDLKPSNVFLTAGGVKVVDFGLARPLATADDSLKAVTIEGVIVGTPQYAAPEQLSGAGIDARADLFSAGVVLFEMLTGRVPFFGTTLPATLHAVMYDTPPVLTGSPAIVALDRVVHRALAKTPVDRYQTAGALRDDLHAIRVQVDDEPVVEARQVMRLAVLPFRWLKPDPEHDYLSQSLAASLTSALSGFESLVVRSSLKSAKYASGLPDLNTLAADLAIDLVLTGSIVRHGDRLRLDAELTSVPAGDAVWRHGSDIALENVLAVHDELAARIVHSLPLSGRDRSRTNALARPSNPKAFDLYLRGMQLRMETSSWRQARSFFEQCLALDPSFVPAWAERGRLDRVIGKYDDPSQLARAEAALREAHALDPDNGAAIHYSAQLDVDLGRVDAALTRLVGRISERRAEPQIYAALVQACRYAGLLEPSILAHERAHALDPTVSTSVLHTYYMKGDYAKALEEGHRGSDPLEARVLAALGRTAEAIEAGRREEERFGLLPRLRGFVTSVRAAAEGKVDEVLATLQTIDASTFPDGEGLFYLAETYAWIGREAEALHLLEEAIRGGFVCLPAFERNPFLSSLRTSRAWQPLVDEVRRRQHVALDAYEMAGGQALLGHV